MTSRAVKAGLLALTVLSTLAIGGSSAIAGGDKVAMCYVSHKAPRAEYNIKVPEARVDDVLDRTLSYLGVCASYGESAALGEGRMRVFSQSRNGVPHAIGVSFQQDMLSGLPYEPPTQRTWCYDKNQDGKLDDHTECVGGYENALHYSKKFRSEVDTPFQYMLINWNPMGHPPPHVYTVPHFDIHFYMNPNEERLAIRPGPCQVLVHCDDFEKATKPLPEKYVAPDYEYTDAVEPAMGNHMMDLTGPEFHGEPFTHSFIYGIYDAKITFYEPMVSLEYFHKLANGAVPDKCFTLKLPQAWETSGWYPTEYCMRYRDNRKELVTTLESFRYRHAG